MSKRFSPVSNAEKRKNLMSLQWLVYIVSIIIIARLVQIGGFHTVDGVDLTQRADQLTQRSSVEDVKRGSIFDASRQPLAVDTTSYSIHASLDPDAKDFVKDPQKTAAMLSKHIDLSYDELLEILSQPDRSQVEFGPKGQQLTYETKKVIESYQLPGISFTLQQKRLHNYPHFASHLLGIVKRDEGGTRRGDSGIEEAYDDILGGRVEGDSQDIYLTLDRQYQLPLEDVLQENFERYHPRSIVGYLVDAKTGKLLAAGQRPTFNLDTLEGLEDEWKSLLVGNAYEPGSTIKSLVMGVALQDQVIRLNDKFESGSVRVYDQIVKDYQETGWGTITYKDGFAHSSNVAMVNIVEKMGPDRWVEILENFGFGQGTGSRLSDEIDGMLSFDNPVSKVMSGFGQGFLATPMQLIQAFSSIGNGGQMLKIQYIDSIGQPNKATYQPVILGEPFSPEVARQVLELMVHAVEMPGGTASNFNHPQVKVAAKTGTAEIADEEGTGYLTGRNEYYFSVISFFPADNPQYMLYLAIERPQTDELIGGTTILGHVFKDFVDQIYTYN
ncbi:penicillin-binding protein 2 [Dolosicoccus paucivorans]|uniref:Penicillin-binding protein 2 n=1 Tax=Dolosicoccus paucivorans TaxID=84521 RepID=A0A2N6SP89_9LACT|nr:penicillin-binding protein 2 [Dolosicoccus paucivorans]PMC58881.1 penicillin-binding protein 2 [Dolosicoccus paucivorans]